jgi:hypothetical protein
VVDQDVPYDACSDGEEVRTVLPRDALRVDEAEIRLIHECSCLKGVIRALVSDVPLRDAMELCLYKGNQPRQSIFVALAPLEQQSGDVAGMVRNAVILRLSCRVRALSRFWCFFPLPRSEVSDMLNKTRAVLVMSGLMIGLTGCSDVGPQSPTAPSAPSPIQQPQPQPVLSNRFPPGVLRDYSLSGMVYEMTATGRIPIEGVAVYCELCGAETHSGASTDSKGFYSFRGVWNAGVFPTSLSIGKAGYEDPPGLPVITPPNLSGDGWREVMVDGDTRFDIELVRR